jgi:predicted N-acetyltransferase YhbS
MAQHPKRPPRPEPACEADCRSGDGEQVGQGACSVALVDGALVGTIMFKPVDRTGGCPGLNRPDEASLGQLAVAPERQALKLGGRLDLMEARAAETGAEEIALDTAESAAHLVGWYGRCGYRQIEHAQRGIPTIAASS